MAQVTVRPYRAEDAPAAVAFFGEAAGLDPTLQAVTPDGWDQYCNMSFNAGARDFAIAERDGARAGVLMSYGGVHQDAAFRHFRIVVHPHHRRRGVGTRLLRLVEAQDDPPTTRLQSNLIGTWTAGQAFARKEGFRIVRSQIFMTRMGPAPDAVPVPEGFTLRAYRGPEDDADWTRLTLEGYGDTPDFSGITQDDLDSYRSGQGFGLCFAERDGDVCGLCHTMDWQDEGPCINSVVVTAKARGCGLGKALTAAGMRAALGAEGTKISLNVVSDNEPALAIYRGLGFETTDESVTWQKPR